MFTSMWNKSGSYIGQWGRQTKMAYCQEDPAAAAEVSVATSAREENSLSSPSSASTTPPPPTDTATNNTSSTSNASSSRSSTSSSSSSSSSSSDATAKKDNKHPLIGNLGNNVFVPGLVPAALPKRKPLPNPGQFGMFRMQSRALTEVLDFFDGFQLTVNKPLTPQFQVSHNYVLGTSMIPKEAGGGMYAFGATLAYDQGRTLIMSRLDSHYRVEGRLFRQVSPHLLAKSTVMVTPQHGKTMSVASASAEYTKDDYSASGEISNAFGRYSFKGSYMQSVTESIALGSGVDLSTGSNTPVTTKLGVRYKSGADCVTAELSSQETLTCDYTRKISNRLSMGSVLHLNRAKAAGKAASTGFGFKYTLKQSSIKGTANSDGRVQVSVKETMGPAISLQICAEMDYLRGQGKFGWGMSFGQ
eukprot:g5467.t1